MPKRRLATMNVSHDVHISGYSRAVVNRLGSAGIVDHVSFSVMRRLGITEAFTNDRHFAAAGFITLF